MKNIKFIIPLAIFIGLCILFYSMLDRDTQLLPSPLIGKPVPEFSIQSLPLTTNTDAITLNQEQFLGKKWIINIWASWCAACRVEHPIFNEIAENTNWTLVGLNYKDAADDARQWLTEFENPYTNIIHDPEGKLGLDLGVYGVPETFLVDEAGIIQYKHVGPICGEIVKAVFLPFFSGEQIDYSATCEAS
jgi:cytochrome c biogenesis protein CcmG/thiol:disulfide interchange protein DsbE